ncbi:MAG: hypothetical protein LKE88_08850 [Acidaminococcus provencensis]|jgi:hypothetical protein|uniref:hypothetical protein n=1 Tax=Acidaminococcus provencensis TaxID=2058289 RepID=UPI0023F10BA6|nr:hypothetical protein [Acidaminococcus provencensis]MCH4096736.1 hypothetical protein [Acidaminococcus provencensis]
MTDNRSGASGPIFEVISYIPFFGLRCFALHRIYFAFFHTRPPKPPEKMPKKQEKTAQSKAPCGFLDFAGIPSASWRKKAKLLYKEGFCPFANHPTNGKKIMGCRKEPKTCTSYNEDNKTKSCFR